MRSHPNPITPEAPATAGAFVCPPNACRWCDREERQHAIEWAGFIGYHKWTEPTTAQRKERMIARRALKERNETA